MKKSVVFILGIVVVLLIAGVWYLISTANKSSAPSQTATPTLIAQATYLCNGGKTIDASFYKGETKPTTPGEPPIPTGSVKLVLSDGRNLDLPQTISADGGRYANSNESFVFWSKGDGALVLENNVEKNYIGCVVPAKETGSTTPPITAPATVTVNIKNFSFDPPALDVKPGTKVIWTNNDNVSHTITSDSGGLLKSGTLSPGQSFAFTFTDAGTVNYHCSIHASMQGVITVR